MKKEKKIILVDMDGVLADFRKSFLREVKNNGWEIKEEQNKMHFKILDDKKEIKKYSIASKKGFYLGMFPVDGAVEAVKEIIEDDSFEVFFCSSPLTEYKNCVTEKYMWIEKYFGFEATKRIILTRDKTLVKGDYLIDDKPEVIGVIENPEWEQIYFTQPYNKNLEGKRITDWNKWREILKLGL